MKKPVPKYLMSYWNLFLLTIRQDVTTELLIKIRYCYCLQWIRKAERIQTRNCSSYRNFWKEVLICWCTRRCNISQRTINFEIIFLFIFVVKVGLIFFLNQLLFLLLSLLSLKTFPFLIFSSMMLCWSFHCINHIWAIFA